MADDPDVAMGKLRAQFPQYNAISDAQLAAGVVAKYPQYGQVLGKFLPSQGSATPPPAAAASPDISGAMSGGAAGGAQGDTTTAPSRSDIDAFKDSYFNTFNETANAPMIVAQGLAKNPNDPALIARLDSMQSPIAKQAIREKAQELRSTGNMHVQGFVPLATPPVFTNPDTGEIAKPSTIGDVAAALIHGPEGANQLANKPGAAAEIERFALHSADPESLAFLAAAGAIGGMGKIASVAGKAITGSGIVKTGIGLMMGGAAVDKAKKGDIGGAVVDAGLAVLPFAEHPISEAAGRVKSKLNNNALDVAQATPADRFAPDTPYQIPEINRAPAPVVPEPTAPLPVAPETGTSPSSATALTPEIVKAAAKDGFTKAADLYKQAKQADPALTKQDFAQQLYDFHKANEDSVNYEGPTGNANKADVFTAKAADGAPIRYFGFSEKTSKPTIQGEADGTGILSSNSGLVAGGSEGETGRSGGDNRQAQAGLDNTGQNTGQVQATPPGSLPDAELQPTTNTTDTVSPGIKIANDETNARRALEGLPDLPGHTWQSNEEIYAEAKARGMDKDALTVADKVLKTGRAMDAHELAANALKQKDIRAERADLRGKIKAATDAGTPTDTMLADYDGLKGQYERLTDATKRSGTAWSQAGHVRQFMLDDYSHENIQQQLEMAKPDEPLNANDKAWIDQHAGEYDKAQKGLDEAQAKVDAQQAGRDEINSVDTATEAVKGMMSKAQRAGRMEVRAEVKAQLEAEHAVLRDKFLRAASQTNAVVALFDPKLLPLIREIAANRVKSGMVSVDALVDHVHGIVIEKIPDATKREVRDAISGHGYGSKIPVGSAFSDLKKQMKLLSEIEDIQSKAPRTTRTKVPVSDEVAALRKQKAEALAEGKPPRKQTSYEKKLEIAKKQLTGTIDDLTRRINEKDFTAKTRSKLLLDPEATELKAQRDALQKVYDSLDPAKQKAPVAPKAGKQAERAAQSRLDSLTKQFEEMKAANAKGEYGNADAPARPDTPEEAAMRHQLDAARAERDAMRAAKSEAPPADPLKAYKNRLATQIADMQTHIDSGLTDRATGGKTKQLDDEAKVLRDQRDQMKEVVNRKRAEIDRAIEARKGKSFLDKYAIYHRAAILSRVTTLAKLSSAGLQRLIFTPAEEGAGALMHAVPGYGKIAKMAPHGTPSIAAEGAALRSVADYKANYAESMQKFRTGMNSLDAKYGTKGYEQDADQLNLFTAPQNAHGAIKTTFQRAAFERSMVQQERYELRRGNDINDPAVRTVMEARAYMKSKEAILMQDNFLATAWNGMVTGLEKNPKLGAGGKVLAATLRAALPIVKVPSNFVGEVASHTPVVGLVRPLVEVGKAKMKGVDPNSPFFRKSYEFAMSKGIENLSPEQADIIVTALKKHAVGTALFALGFFNANRMGGFYAKGGNGMNDVKPNEIRINLFGKELDIPSWLLHSPQMEVMMMGAAFKQAIEQARNSRSREEKSPAGEALHRTATGLADALPFVDTPKRVLGVMEGTTQAGKEVGNTLGSLTLPGFLPDIASQIDRDPRNHLQTRNRPAKGFGDAIKLSTGVLRGTVPVDSGRRR